MDSYTDIKIIEANRLHSEEAKSGNNENYSLWTNNLQDILHLEPKDQVSVYGAFISERGAGQSSSIEIKGVELGEFHNFSYVNLSKTIDGTDRIDNNLPSGASKIKVALSLNTPYAIRDDTLRFTMSYYMVASTQNSLHLPRRWMWGHPVAYDNFHNDDDVATQGATLTQYFTSNASSLTKVFSQTNDFYSPIGASNVPYLKKPNNDNSRYTIMVRDKTYFTPAGIAADGGAPLPSLDARDPEAGTYFIFKELKEITIPSGFNSADYIATEITRQLQGITRDEILYQRNSPNEIFPIEVSKILESQTYKVFNTGSIDDNKKDNFLKYFDLVGSGNTLPDKATRGGFTNSSGFEWLRQYQFVGCKYPELYETGRLLNRNHAQVYQNVLGAKLYQAYDGGLDPLVFDIPYNKQRVDEFKAFFDAQKLYPQIIENLNSSNASGYNPGNTIHNTRWCHINRWDFAKQSLSQSPDVLNTQLGWGGYYYPRSYNPNPALVQLCSMLICLYFDESQSETYYSSPDSDGKNEYTYGCIGKVNNRIAIYPSRHPTNGWVANQSLWDKELFKPYFGVGAETIEEGRKIGFDLHFNAPGMYYLLPLSGWNPYTDPNWTKGEQSGYYKIPNASQDNTNVATSQLRDLNSWKKLLYLGADNPTLNWDGTNFSFSDFHTGINRGNSWEAGNPSIVSFTNASGYNGRPYIPVDVNAQDIVYKVNPSTDIMDWTPDRCPYNIDPYSLKSIYGASGSTADIKVPRVNDNIEKWRIYDMLSGIFIEDFGCPENLWTNSLWGLLGFTYQQFHSIQNNRLTRIQSGNANRLSLLTTNSEVIEGDTKIFSTNWAGTPMFNGMITTPSNILGYNSSGTAVSHWTSVYPEIVHKTESIKIIAENLPTRMIRGYYTIRSNIIEGTPFIGGKVNNTTMPIIGVVDKINGDGDFYFGSESSLNFTITKPLRLASISVSIHDPDGSYARTSEQSTILFKVQKTLTTTFNIAAQLLQQNKNNPVLQNLNNPSL